MKIIPAIDIINGQCVRLLKGDFNQQTTYPTNPLDLARKYETAGAKYLHIIDLNGAKCGRLQQKDLIANISAQSTLNIQVGGGIRTIYDIDERLLAGVAKVVLGSVAVQDPELTENIIDEFRAEHLILAIDVNVSAENIPYVAINGWQKDSRIEAYDLISRYLDCGLNEILCTDISKDGTESGPNFNLYGELLTNYPGLEILASGGVHSLTDLKQLESTGVTGVIIGKALLEERFTIEEALHYGE
jgi:phosphoribosylformimino-5-aminoimidazole carboxamide ribotide isomerase